MHRLTPYACNPHANYVAQSSKDSTRRCNQLHTAHDLRRDFPLNACPYTLSLIGASPNYSCQIIAQTLKFVYSLDSPTLTTSQKLPLCADTTGNIEISGMPTIEIMFVQPTGTRIYFMSRCAVNDKRRDRQASPTIEGQFTNLSATATVLG